MTIVNSTLPGRPDPLGASPQSGGVNFSLFSYHASGVELLLFDHPDQDQPSAIIELKPEIHRTGSYWHIFVPGLETGQIYQLLRIEYETT